MKIMRGPAVPQLQVLTWMRTQAPHARFTEHMFWPLWAAATHRGVDPIGVVCQAAKETAWGRYGGAVAPWQHNTCGLRIKAAGLEWIEELRAELDPTDSVADETKRALHRMSHACFASWHQGAIAHVQHLMAYTGLTVQPYQITDPRLELIAQPYVTHWRELGGRWAPSPDYGTQIEAMITDVVAHG